jgi:hypothetical protein
MAKQWSEVETNPEFQALSAEEKYAVREDYFNKVIAPEVPAKERDAVKDDFYGKTHSRLFGTGDEIGLAVNDVGRGASNMLTLGMADRAVAAGRAAFDSDLDYADALAQETERTRLAKDRLGWAGTALELASGAKLGMKAAEKGLTLVGREGIENAGVIGKTLAGVAEGAGWGAASNVGNNYGSLEEKVAAAGEGALYGGATGGVASAALQALPPAMRALLGQRFDTNASISDGTRLNNAAQEIAENALGPSNQRAAQDTLSRMAEMGDDTLALNANRRLGAAAQGIVRKPDFNTSANTETSSDIVRNAVEAQMDGRSGRIAAGVNDAIGKNADDAASIIERAKEEISDTRPEYSKILEGKPVKPSDRTAIIRAAQKAGKSLDKTKAGTALERYTQPETWPTDAQSLINMRNDINDLAKDYPYAAQAFHDVNRAINARLSKMTGGKGGKFDQLQAIQSKNKQTLKDVEAAKDFFNKDTPARIVTANLAKATPEGRDVMTKVSRDSFDQTIRGPGNDITNLHKAMGRHGNATVRDNIEAVWGTKARDQLTNLVESEASKTADYGRIIGGSKTAETQGAAMALDESLGNVPLATTPTGVLKSLAQVAMQKRLISNGGMRGDASRQAIAKVTTLNRDQLINLLRELDRARGVRQTVRGINTAVVPAVSATAVPD